MFKLGKFEVTFDEYYRFVLAKRMSLPEDQKWGRGRRPVINVSWEDTVKYAKWLSEQSGKRYRLPTEAEWEYAARSGGKDEVWAGTSSEQELGSFAWYAANSGGTQGVGKKRSNALGLHDMSGNVREWVEDCWHENYLGAPPDSRAWNQENGGNCGERVIRGGSWGSRPEDLRSSDRFWLNARIRGNDLGFRLTQDIVE